MADSADQFPPLASAYKGPGRRVSHPSPYVTNTKVASGSQEYKNKFSAKTWCQKKSNPSAREEPKGNCVSEMATKNALPVQSADPWGSKGTRSAYTLPMPEAQNGWSRFSQSGPSRPDNWKDPHVTTELKVNNVFDERNDASEYDDDSDIVYDSDELDDDDYDYNANNEDRKVTRRFSKFFESLDKLTTEQIKSSERQWHCPACQGGPGAIDWYRGLEPIMVHAKTVKTRKARMHREFADLLDQELRKRRISVSASGEVSGQWEGLKEAVKDYDIVWPPMVIIMNTSYEQDENDKWIGMGNQELLDYFSSYAASKAKHSYGPKGHRGMSVLIFDGSVAGYLEALRLHKHFKEQERDRDAWDKANQKKERDSWARSRHLYRPGGKRQLYGYLALEEDLNIFNQHSGGKSKLKFELRSYLVTVESQLKQLNYDSRQVTQLKEKMDIEQKKTQALQQTMGMMSEKLHQTTKENQILKQRTKLQHEQHKEEMDAQEEFYNEQMDVIYRALNSKEDNFENLWRAAQQKVEKMNPNPSTTEAEQRVEVLEEFEAERQKLISLHQDKKSEIMKRYWSEMLELEKELEQEATLLMEKYTPQILDRKTN